MKHQLKVLGLTILIGALQSLSQVLVGSGLFYYIVLFPAVLLTFYVCHLALNNEK